MWRLVTAFMQKWPGRSVSHYDGASSARAAAMNSKVYTDVARVASWGKKSLRLCGSDLTLTPRDHCGCRDQRNPLPDTRAFGKFSCDGRFVSSHVW